MSLNSFHLKGSGWYVTDYAGKKPSTQVDKSSGESGDKVNKAEKSERSESSSKNNIES
jgi:predicted nucleic acid-binding Zn ribbon protein